MQEQCFEPLDTSKIDLDTPFHSVLLDDEVKNNLAIDAWVAIFAKKTTSSSSR